MDSLDHHFSLDDNNFITYSRVTFIKELTINELSYKNMKELSRYMKAKYGSVSNMAKVK